MTKKTQNHTEEDDIILEEDFTEDSQVDKKYHKKIKKLQEDLHKCKSEKEEYLSGWQRSQADFINYKKNNYSIFEQAKETSKIELVESFLPICDSFEMALTGTFDDSFKKWLTGFEYIYQQFKKVLKENNVEEIYPLGKEFSPKEHEALGEIETNKKELDAIVAEVILKGYKTDSNKIIRAAQVKVYKYQK